MEEGYIKLSKKILDWGWFTDPCTLSVFIYCLLRANWKPGKFQGEVIERGQFPTSLAKMSVETGLSVQNVRTALKHLEATGELTSKSQGKYRIITVLNYCRYQDANKELTSELTSNQQGTNKELTTIEEIKKERNKEIYNNPPLPPLNPPKGKRTTKQAKVDHNVNLLDELVKQYGFSEGLTDLLREWMRYKGSEKGFMYQETGLKALLSQTSKHLGEYGESAVTDCINLSMSNGYQGIVWDRLKDGKSTTTRNNGYTFLDMWKEEYG